MENEKLYMISEDTYHKHIDEKIHLYGFLRQLAFLAGKVESPHDAEHLAETATLYGRTAEEMFKGWHIPGRYLVYGDTEDLEALKETELFPMDADIIFGIEDDPCDYCKDDICEVISDLLSRMESLMGSLEAIFSELGELDGE